jgi:hypothetical protein
MNEKEITFAVISDLHCGGDHGLAPAGFRREKVKGNASIDRIIEAQYARYDWYRKEIVKVKAKYPKLHLICNGDAVDGQGTRVGGAERMEALERSVDAAEVCIREWDYPGLQSISLTGGTGYHTRTPDGSIDLEKMLRTQVQLSIGKQTFFDYVQYIELVGGPRSFIIKCRHDTPKGGILSGGPIGGAVKQLTMAGALESRKAGPRIDLLLLSHVHEYCPIPVIDADGTARYVITTPALCGRGGIYAETKCTGMTHFGFIVITVRFTTKGFELDIDDFITQLPVDKTQTRKIHF